MSGAEERPRTAVEIRLLALEGAVRELEERLDALSGRAVLVEGGDLHDLADALALDSWARRTGASEAEEKTC